mgnify:CR=1 FL=1
MKFTLNGGTVDYNVKMQILTKFSFDANNREESIIELKKLLNDMVEGLRDHLERLEVENNEKIRETC